MTATSDAHDALRAAIRAAALARWDDGITREAERADLLAETRPEVEHGILLDYVVVGVFDAGHDHTVTAVLRTDDDCPTYKTLGLLELGREYLR